MAIPKESRVSRVLAGCSAGRLQWRCRYLQKGEAPPYRHRLLCATACRVLFVVVGAPPVRLPGQRYAARCSQPAPGSERGGRVHRDSRACLPLLVPLSESACCQLRMDGREPVNSRTMTRGRIVPRRATTKLQRLKPVTPNAPMMKPPITPPTIPTRMSPMRLSTSGTGYGG